MKNKIILIFFFISSIGFSQDKIIYDIKFKNVKKTDISFFKKIITAKPGEKLDTIVLQKAIRTLKTLPLISHAYFQVFQSHENLYNVFIYIEENKTIIPFGNFYTTNNDEFAYRIGVNEFNFLGQGIQLGGFFQKDIFNSFAINFKAPFLFSRKLGLAINYQDLTTLEPVFFNNTTADYKYNNTSIEVLGLYQINFKNRIETGLNLFTEDYTYQTGATDPNVPLDLDVKKSLVKFIYDFNSLDYNYELVDGFRSLLNFQYVWVRGNENRIFPNFSIAWNDLFYFKSYNQKNNWANRLRVGFASNENTPFAPFAVDNNLNIRGVGFLIDRGTGVVVYNTEYRYRIFKKKNFIIQGNVFLDAGSWRNPGGNLNDFFDSENLRVFPGVGLRFIHRKFYNAIFRIDYGYGISKNATQGLVFGIGQYF